MKAITLAVLSFVLTFILAGCTIFGSPSPTAEIISRSERTGTDTPTFISSAIPVGRPERIVISGVSVRYREAFVLKGGSTLPDGACILTQLYSDGILQDWWPSGTCSEVQNGGWLFIVDLADEEFTDVLPAGPEYSVVAWSRVDPAIKSPEFKFDIQPPSQTESPTTEVTVIPDSLEITVSGVTIERLMQITFTGRSALPDGSCLLTQLSANGGALEWWPSDLCAEVINGEWRIVVRLGSGGLPEELPEDPEYTFVVWLREDPGIESEVFVFDLQSPPPDE
jgi:hypothetical protein